MTIETLLIDPVAREVRPVDYSGDWRSIAVLLECAPSPFTVVQFPRGDALYVDDEGLLKQPRHFFIVNGYDGLLAGRGLFMGTNREGNAAPLRVVTLEWLRDNVAFFERSTVVPGGWSMTHARGFDSMAAFVRARQAPGGLTVMVLG